MSEIDREREIVSEFEKMKKMKIMKKKIWPLKYYVYIQVIKKRQNKEIS